MILAIDIGNTTVALGGIRDGRVSVSYTHLDVYKRQKKHWTKYDKHVILVQSDRSVSMTVRFHLFPFRTQKLSSLVPKIVRWKRRVKIGSRRLEQKALR